MKQAEKGRGVWSGLMAGCAGLRVGFVGVKSYRKKIQKNKIKMGPITLASKLLIKKILGNFLFPNLHLI